MAIRSNEYAYMVALNTKHTKYAVSNCQQGLFTWVLLVLGSCFTGCVLNKSVCIDEVFRGR